MLNRLNSFIDALRDPREALRSALVGGLRKLDTTPPRQGVYIATVEEAEGFRQLVLLNVADIVRDGGHLVVHDYWGNRTWLKADVVRRLEPAGPEDIDPDLDELLALDAVAL